jgi:hypothetical protein
MPYEVYNGLLTSVQTDSLDKEAKCILSLNIVEHVTQVSVAGPEPMVPEIC